MTEGEPIDQFSLLGGPLHRLGCRLGLVRHGTNTVLLGIVMGTLPWLVIVLVAWFEGIIPRLFSLDVIGIHVRLLVVIPLFFLCESVLDPKIRTFASYCVRSGVVAAGALREFEGEIARVTRRKNAWLPDAACLVMAVVMAIGAPEISLGETASLHLGKPLSLAGWSYWILGLTVFRFLLLRWTWRLALWFHFLWRLSRLELHLMPAHADRTGGLGSLFAVHEEFAVLITAISAIMSASFAEDIVTGGMAFDSVYIAFPLIFLADALLFLLPLCVFTPKLRACKRTGLRDYMELAARYVTDFQRKWLVPGAAPAEPLLGTPDLQSLADISNAINVVREMRWAPIDAGLLKTYLVAALLPLLPLLLLKYPVASLAQQFFRRLVGL
jgi:hypothetical protein